MSQEERGEGERGRSFVVVVMVIAAVGVVCNSWTDMNTCWLGVFSWEKPVSHPAGVWAWLRNVGVSRKCSLGEWNVPKGGKGTEWRGVWRAEQNGEGQVMLIR